MENTDLRQIYGQEPCAGGGNTGRGTTVNDGELLKQYVDEGSEPAFEELVKRHTDLVYSSALRRVGPGSAEDVAQAVFVVLARKAPKLARRSTVNLSGWLFRATRFAALDALKKERRRRERENAAAEGSREEMQAQQMSEEWEQVKPVLDEGLDRLSRGDRDAVLLRFFRGASFAEVGETMGISENTAAKRVSRALQKLHRFLSRKGVTLSMPILSSLLASRTTEAAPPEITASCTTAALAGVGVLAGGGTISALLIADGVMKAMAVNRIITTAVATCVLLTAGTGTVVTVKRAVTEHAAIALGREQTGMRLVAVKPVTLEYKAASTLPGGVVEYQINTQYDERTYFARLGEEVEGYILAKHEARTEERDVSGIAKPVVVDISELTLERGNERIVLTRNRPVKSARYSAHLLLGPDDTDRYLGIGDTFNLEGSEYQVAEVPPKLDRIVLRRTADDRKVVLLVGE